MEFNLIKHKFQQALEIYLEQDDANLLDAKLNDIISIDG